MPTFTPGQTDYLEKLNEMAGAYGVWYLGAKTANPTVDNNGDALVAGAFYLYTPAPEFRAWSGSAWVAAPTGTYVPSSYMDSDGTLAANSDAKIATQKAVKTYVTAGLAAKANLAGSSSQAFAAAALNASGNIQSGTGAASSTQNIVANGGASGTGAGGAFAAQNNTLTIIGFGNKSAVVGGSYDATPYLYGSSAISTNVGLNIGGNIEVIGSGLFSAGYYAAGPATVGATSTPGVVSFENPVVRHYTGDGTGYSTRFSKRSGSVTTDLVSINDIGTTLEVVGSISSTGVYSNTTASAANVFVDSSGNLVRSTSTRALKTEVEDMDPSIALKLVELFRAVWYRSLCPGDNPDWSWFGGIAEEVAQIDPRFVHYGYLDTDYEMVEVDDGEIEEQIVDTVLTDQTSIEIQNGVPVQITKQVETQVPRVEQVQVVDADGIPLTVERTMTDDDGVETSVDVPLMHPVPVMQRVKKTHKERRLKSTATLSPVGLQYERFTVPLMLVTKLHEARITALEAKQ